MAARWTQSSYWKFVHAAQDKHGLDVPGARALYREVKAREGGKVFASYIEKHPVITGRAVRKVEKEARRAVLEKRAKAERKVRGKEAEEIEEEFTGAFDTGGKKRRGRRR